MRYVIVFFLTTVLLHGATKPENHQQKAYWYPTPQTISSIPAKKLLAKTLHHNQQETKSTSIYKYPNKTSIKKQITKKHHPKHSIFKKVKEWIKKKAQDLNKILIALIIILAVLIALVIVLNPVAGVELLIGLLVLALVVILVILLLRYFGVI